tara:strand:- start:81 stop:524 length:444 start_codon:yes stop_codon:yes gene_type:complete
VESIPPSEVVSVEIINFANNFGPLYRDVYPQADMRSIPSWGNVIAIYTQAGKGLHGVEKPKGIQQFTIEGFAPSKEFYAPKYETTSQLEDDKPDYRSLLHWQPNLSVRDSTTISYYNDDKPGKKYIVIEGISRDGRLGHAVMSYIVR